MFKKLKDKIAEDLKFSPQRLTQPNTEKTLSSNDENFFSIAEDDAGASTSSLGGEFTDVSLHASTPMESRIRKLSNSSMASDISFLPRYEPSGNLYHMQSDLDASASEIEDNASTSSQLGQISKEQVYSAFQKAQLRYHKYRGRYTDLANHYKALEKENSKIRTILVDTQDKAIRRVNELKEQCALEQKAKAHLENALRVELDEKQIKIDTLHTKIKFLQSSDKSEQLIDINDSRTSDNSQSTSNSSLSDRQAELQELSKYLNDARVEIENLNGKLQEMKANAIIFNTKESDYRQKIYNMERILNERNTEINLYSEREKENNLKLAQSKMELHAEIHNKDLEIANLKRDLENMKQEMERNEKSKMSIKLENLQTQNVKLIDKVETLSQKCANYETELIKLEQYKIEIGNLNEFVQNLKKINDELNQKTVQTDEDHKKYEEIKREYNEKVSEFENISIKFKDLQIEFDYNKNKLESLMQEKDNLETNIEEMKEEINNLQRNEAMKDVESSKAIQVLTEQLKEQCTKYDEMIQNVRNDAKKSLLTLETKIKEKLNGEFETKEANLKQEFEDKLEKLLSNSAGAKEIEIKLMETEDLLKKIESENFSLKSAADTQKNKYSELENNHLDLINESNQTRKDLSNLDKENNNQKNTIASLGNDILSLREDTSKLEEELQIAKSVSAKLQEEIEVLKSENLNLSNASSKEEDLNEVLSEKIEENNQMRENISQLELSILQKDQELQHMRKMHEELLLKISEYQVLQTEFTLLQEVSTKQQNENCVLNEEKRSFEKKIENLTNDIIGLKQERTKLQEELQQNREEQDKVIKTNENLKKKIEDLQVENEKLSEHIENLLQKNSHFGEEISSYSEENLKLKNEIKNVQVRQNNYETTINKMKEEIRKNEELLQEFDTKNYEVEKLQHNIKEMDLILEELKKEKSKISENLTKRNTEIDGIKRKYEEINKEKNDIFTRLMKTEQDNQHLKDERAKLSKEMKTSIEKEEQKEKELETLKQSFEVDMNELKKKIEELKEYETKYQGILDENHNLKEQISKIEELREKLQNFERIEDNCQAISKEKEMILRDLDNTEKQKGEILNENKKFKREILDLKILNEKLKDVGEENAKLKEDISNLQSQIHETMGDNQNLSEELSKFQHMTHKYNDIFVEIGDLRNKCQQFTNENAELSERNQQLTMDYKQILHENEKHVGEFAEFKLKYDELGMRYHSFEELKQQFVRENEDLKFQLEQTTSRLNSMTSEKLCLEKLQSSTLETSENQTSSLKSKLKQLQEEKSDYESLFNECKQMKTDVNNVTQLYDKCLKDKGEIETQLRELERHYNEMEHEKQLLKDEIQELKISPLNLNNKLDSLEVLNTEKKYVKDESSVREMEGLREKLEQYKSIDKANRSSIEFYEIELQKLKVKNEKLSRKLDDTLVTLPVLTGSNDLGDSHAKLEYLRNVLFNYMTGRENLVLAKVIAAVCKFDKEETELIMMKEQQRQTLLGQLFGS